MSDWLWWLVFLTFNLPIAGFLVTVPFGKRLNQVLKEKAPDGTAGDATSYSRVTGALGAVVLTSFYWAIGNASLSLALSDVTKVKPLMDAVSPFFLIGSALFLPYAFNQLKSIFPWTANAAVAMAQLNQGAAIAPISVELPIGPAPARLIVANLSNISQDVLKPAIAAIQLQIDTEFKPEWGVTTSLSCQQFTLAGPQIQLNATDAIIYLGNQAQDPNGNSDDVQGLLGHHAVNYPGVPYGFVFLDACETRGADWSVILSHEVLELLIDPQLVGRVSGPDPKIPGAPDVLFEFEICDPTDGDSYQLANVNVANFITRRYFGGQGHWPSTNRLGYPLAPFSARPGGYAQYHDGTGIQTLNGNAVAAGQFAARTMMGAGRRNARRAGT